MDMTGNKKEVAKPAQGREVPDNVNRPVQGIDSATNQYGMLKLKNPDIADTITKSFANMHGNILNETDDKTETQGESGKIDRMKALARRMAKAY